MTEKEVIKALECCLSDAWEDCDKCPLEKFPDDYIGCRKNLMKVTIDFINRQKAEIEQLKKEKEEMHQKVTRTNKYAWKITRAIKSIIETTEDIKDMVFMMRCPNCNSEIKSGFFDAKTKTLVYHCEKCGKYWE